MYLIKGKLMIATVLLFLNLWQNKNTLTLILSTKNDFSTYSIMFRDNNLNIAYFMILDNKILTLMLLFIYKDYFIIF